MIRIEFLNSSVCVDFSCVWNELDHEIVRVRKCTIFFLKKKHH